jgi:hypothetical protein
MADEAPAPAEKKEPAVCVNCHDRKAVMGCFKCDVVVCGKAACAEFGINHHRFFTCSICENDRLKWKNFPHPEICGPCEGQVCIECIRKAAQTQDWRSAGETCPMCDDDIVDVDHYFDILGKDLVARIKEHEASLKKARANEKARREALSDLERYAEYRRSKRTSQRHCPGCGLVTEKIEGCDHMTCAVCYTHWCMRCGFAYDDDDYHDEDWCYEHLDELQIAAIDSFDVYVKELDDARAERDEARAERDCAWEKHREALAKLDDALKYKQSVDLAAGDARRVQSALAAAALVRDQLDRVLTLGPSLQAACKVRDTLNDVLEHPPKTAEEWLMIHEEEKKKKTKEMQKSMKEIVKKLKDTKEENSDGGKGKGEAKGTGRVEGKTKTKRKKKKAPKNEKKASAAS